MSRTTGRPSYLREAERSRERRNRLLVMVACVLAAALVGGLVGYLVGRPDATTRAIEGLRAEEARRDLQQIGDLTALARQSQAVLDPLLADFDTTIDERKPVEAATVERWRTTVRQLVDRHAESPSGTTATNVARGAFRSALHGFNVAVDLLATAQQLPAEQRLSLTATADRVRTDAATTWSVAATQLDQINVDAGLGHQHVYLRTEQGSGAFTSDGAPEGTGG
ncbi:hypothetical protein AAH979_40320 [Plantactinospora sp. ZYX-F-223]|uniref:hypothetical protein n=1 Tax=Plantactinospora sp. ZYX-F-223 TaxID=3144103 RepID=UPI0031FDF4E9